MPASVDAGAKAPPFRLPSTVGEVTLDGMLADGRRLVLAFYFEDGTPSCESEVRMLADAHEMLTEFNARVLAVSTDSIESHRAFAERLGGVPFPLASDEDLTAARAYDVVDGGDARRSRRAVFVVDADGTVLLALPHFQPNNISHFEAIFLVLGAET
jgi:peroxiredoxin